MEMRFEELLEKVTDFIKSEAKTETVVGETFQLGDFSCVPVVRIGMGFGSGGGSGNDPKKGQGGGGGAGAGVSIDPIGFLVSKENEISFISTGKSKGISSMFEKIPDFIEKMTQKKEKESSPV